MLRSFLPFLLANMLLLTGCSSDEDAPRPNEPSLQDSWTWVQSSGGIAGRVTTPASSGNQMQVEFGTDNTVRYYLNGRLTSTDTYTVKRGSSIRTSQPTMLIQYGRGNSASFEVSGNHLTLWDEAYDGFKHEYQR